MEALGELESLGELFTYLLRAGFTHRFFELFDELGKFDTRKNVANGLGTHSGREALHTILFLSIAEFEFREELSWLQRSVTWVDNDVIFVVNYALELSCAHIEHEADARRHALIEPDVGNRDSKLDVPHALTTDARESHLDAAAVTDSSLVLDSLVFSAGALPVLGRTENSLTEETAFLWLEGPVVNRFRILHFATTPRADRVGIGDRNADVIEAVGLALKAEDFVQMGF